jgi:hypothetical protein
MMNEGGSIRDSSLSVHHSSFPALDALLLFFILNLVLQPPVDPDFGWHLRTGLDLVEHGWQMPITDPYSHTLPDWPWVEHAWVTDGLLAMLYHGLGSAGTLGVILFFAAGTAGAFLIVASLSQASRTHRLLAIAAALWVALPFLGARTQMISWLGLAIVLRLSWLYQTGRLSSLWSLPPLFLVWTNLHGGFTAGLFTLGLILVAGLVVRLAVDRVPRFADFVEEPMMARPRLAHLAFMIALAGLATLVNPYGWRLHAEIYESLSNTFMIETLHEWQPVSLSTRAGAIYLGYLAGLGLLMLGFYRRVEPVRGAVILVFLMLSLKHWRNVPLFLLVSVPLCADLLGELAGRIATRVGNVRHQKRWLLAATMGVAVVMAILGSDHLQRVAQAGLAPDAFFRESDYPIEAIEWVKAHREQVGTRLYNDYGHGGFLLWWLPGEKIFIDGRMPAWRIGDRWIFYDYAALAIWDPPELRVLDKYGVDWAIVGRNSPLDDALAQQPKWREVYGDKKVTIYVRK